MTEQEYADGRRQTFDAGRAPGINLGDQSGNALRTLVSDIFQGLPEGELQGQTRLMARNR
jgi:hypothetical protein